jgi:hypothetical protein
VEQGYEPDTSHTCCNMTYIRSKFKNKKLIIRTQQFNSNGLDGSIRVDNEQTYNKMNKVTKTIK